MEVEEELEMSQPDSMGATVMVETKAGGIFTAKVDQPKGTPGIVPC